MDIRISKTLKAIISVMATIVLIFLVVAFSFYFYFADGVEFKIEKSNQFVKNIIEKYEIDFSNESSIYFKARESKIDSYIILHSPSISRNAKPLIKSENLTISSTINFWKILQFFSEIFFKDNTNLDFISQVNIKLKKPLLDISNFKNKIKVPKGTGKFFNILIYAENGKMIDDKIEIGQFDLSLKVNQYLNTSVLDSYKIRLKSSDKFPVSYISQFFVDIESIGELNENISFDLTLEDSDLINSDNTQKLNGLIQVRNTTLKLKKFPASLKPEPIYSLNLDLNIVDNIGQVNLIGSVYNPKKRWKFQTQNLQIGGIINFQEILKPNLDLIVNGKEIYFAKLDNTNLNGIADLTVSIIGKNVLDLNGSLKIKKSNGFLVPLTDTEFNAKHKVRN
tara:strand:+ start:38 stop:1219 length:1182 start_codon:yes stop_codon:yes gene_type:complete